MKITLRILILALATMLMAWPTQADARDHHRYRGSYYRSSYYHGGPRYVVSYRSYPRYYSRPYYYGRPAYSTYYDDAYYGDPYYGYGYSRPAVSISLGGFGGGYYHHHHHR